MTDFDSSVTDNAISNGKVNKLALVVGVNNSVIPGTRETLQHGEQDAFEIAWVLQERCGFSLTEPVLRGQEAETGAVQQAIMKLIKRRTDQDFLLFYFSGHAQPMETPGGHRDIYLVTHNFDESDVILSPSTHISMCWLREMMYEKTDASAVLLILDCCYGGNIIQNEADPYYIDFGKLIESWLEESNSRVQKNCPRLILTATGYNVIAQERVGHGRMTYYMLQALLGDDEALDHDGQVDVLSLYKYLKKKIPEQYPDLAGNQGNYNWVLTSYPDKAANQVLQNREAEDKKRWEGVHVLVDKLSKLLDNAEYLKHTKLYNSQPFDYTACRSASLTDLDLKKLDKFFEQSRFLKQKEAFLNLPIEERLTQLGLLREGYPTYGALLCFGQHPQYWVPNAITHCIKWNINDNYDQLEDSRSFDGDLLSQFESSRSFLREWVHLPRVISSEGSVEQWEVPFRALEEALANALIHRDYENQNGFVQVQVFDDRIEISSPGGPPASIQIALLGSETTSYPRNFQIASIFHLFGYFEQAGSGIPRMQRLMGKARLPAPNFELSPLKTLKVTLYRPERTLNVTKESELRKEVSELTDKILEVSSIITNSGYFEKVAKAAISSYLPLFDQTINKMASISDLNHEKIIEFFKKDLVQIQDDFQRGAVIQNQLQQFGLLIEDHPTFGALLCFGLSPTKWIAGAFTRCTKWFGNDRNRGWEDTQDCRRDLISQFELSCNFLRKNLYSTILIDRVGRTEVLEIPFIALQEALANALIHREYLNQVGSINVDIFVDRIEITSPGLLPEPLSLELLQEEHQSHPRNPQIARIFYLYGYVETVGSGIERIQRSMKDAELPPVKFEQGKDRTFKVFFSRPQQTQRE